MWKNINEKCFVSPTPLVRQFINLSVHATFLSITIFICFSINVFCTLFIRSQYGSFCLWRPAGRKWSKDEFKRKKRWSQWNSQHFWKYIKCDDDKIVKFYKYFPARIPSKFRDQNLLKIWCHILTSSNKTIFFVSSYGGNGTKKRKMNHYKLLSFLISHFSFKFSLACFQFCFSEWFWKFELNDYFIFHLSSILFNVQVSNGLMSISTVVRNACGWKLHKKYWNMLNVECWKVLWIYIRCLNGKRYFSFSDRKTSTKEEKSLGQAEPTPWNLNTIFWMPDKRSKPFKIKQ